MTDEICCSTRGDGKPDVPCPHSPTGLLKHRLDGWSGSRLDAGLAVGAIARDVVRLDGDAAEDAVRMDAREEARRKLEYRLANQWRPDYDPAAPVPRLDSAEEARDRAVFRINNAARPPGAPARMELYRKPNETERAFQIRKYVAGENSREREERRIYEQGRRPL